MKMASEMIVRASGSPGRRSGLEMDSFNNKIGLWGHAGSFWELLGRSGPEMDTFNNKNGPWEHAGSVLEHPGSILGASGSSGTRSGPEMDSFNKKNSVWEHAGSFWEFREPFGAGNGQFQ